MDAAAILEAVKHVREAGGARASRHALVTIASWARKRSKLDAALRIIQNDINSSVSFVIDDTYRDLSVALP